MKKLRFICATLTAFICFSCNEKTAETSDDSTDSVVDIEEVPFSNNEQENYTPYESSDDNNSDVDMSDGVI